MSGINDELTDEQKKIIHQVYDNIIEYYQYIMDKSTDYYITVEECEDIFEAVKDDLMMNMYENNENIINGVLFYCDIYDNIKEIKTYQELKKVIKYYYIDNKDSPYLETKYNIVGALMRITTHIIWQKCYKCHPRFRATPEEAIKDILNPIECSQQLMKEILKELNENEKNKN